MVHFDAAPSAHRHVRLAVDLANRFQAALIGIAGRSYVLAIDEGPDGEQKQIDTLADIGREFHAAAKHVRHTEWRGNAELVSNLVSNEARAADLVVIGRDTGSDELHLALDPGIAVLRAGRPVLVVPEEVDLLSARRIMLAWKNSRESRRAVSDALPFLKEATEVLIAQVCEVGNRDGEPEERRGRCRLSAPPRGQCRCKGFSPQQTLRRRRASTLRERWKCRPHCRRRLRAQPIRRVDVRRGHARVAGQEPALLPVLALRRKGEGGST